MALHAALKLAVVAGLLSWTILPITAHATGADELKVEIETFIGRINRSGNDVLRWEGAESIDVRDDGADAVAEIVKGKLSFHPENAKPSATPVEVTFDRIEVRRSPEPGADDRFKFTVKAPALSRFSVSDGSDVTLALKDAVLTAVIEGPAEHERSVVLDVPSGRVEHQKSGSWLTFGPLVSSWKLDSTDNGGWTTPIEFELKSIEFLAPEGSATGTVERIGYTGVAAGPSLGDFETLRDRLAEMREETDPNKRVAKVLELLPKILAAFTGSKGELAIERVNVKNTDGRPAFSLDKVALGGSVAGLDGDRATWRFTLSHDGLAIDPASVSANQVPRRAIVDFGLEDISVPILRNLAEAAGHMGPDAADTDKQQSLVQIIAAAMTLSPTFHLYKASVEFPSVKIDATGEAKREPPPPLGYTAVGDVTVRGFDALSDVVTDINDRQHLPLLKFIGEPGTDADGAKIVKFHLAAASGKPITVNGSDIADWFRGGDQFGHLPAKPPRPLRLADPPEKGDDVRAVQKAVKADEVEPFTDGVYDTATALAVARYQKASDLNVSGVVDTQTALKLGLPAPEKSPAPKN
jgi:peptidoglycan hydrolase-like protein with peptidoglycan-binding domain